MKRLLILTAALLAWIAVASIANAATVSWVAGAYTDGTKFYYSEVGGSSNSILCPNGTSTVVQKEDPANPGTMIDFQEWTTDSWNLIPGISYNISAVGYNPRGESAATAPVTWNEPAYVPTDDPAPPIINLPGAPQTTIIINVNPQ